MNTMNVLAISHAPVSSVRKDRVRPWLVGKYEDTKWVTKDTNGGTDTRELDFEFLMPDGRLLTAHPSIYATVKEFTFWIREGLFQDIKDAETHRNYFNAVIQFAYAIVDRGRSSFSQLVPLDVEELARAAQYGADKLYRASEKLQMFLAGFSSWDNVPTDLRRGSGFNRHAILRHCNLPKWITPKLNFEFQVAAARLTQAIPPARPEHFDRKVTNTHIKRYKTTFEGLYVLKFVMKADGLSFMPTGDNGGLNEFKGEEAEKTEIAPIGLMLELLEKSVRYLMDHRQEALANYRLACAGRSNGSMRLREAYKPRSDIQQIIIAAYIIIAAFTARRTGEIRLTARDCLAGNDGYGYWLKVYILKNHQSKTWIPVPTIVARAVETLLEIDVRDELRADDTLFTYYDCVSKSVVECHAHLKLNQFAEKIGVSQYEEGGETKKWPWITRHFRRFFAVLYLYRFQGNIEALSHHLRHFNLEMTRSYLTLDPELKAIWLKEEWGFKKKLAVSIAMGTDEYSGPMGDRLKKLARKMIERFYGQITIVEQELVDVILKTIDRRSYVFKPQYWVTCTCPNTQLASERANCRKIEGAEKPTLGPSFAHAAPPVCGGCPHALLDKRNWTVIDGEINRLNALQENPPTTLFEQQQTGNLVKLTAFQARSAA